MISLGGDGNASTLAGTGAFCEAPAAYEPLAAQSLCQGPPRSDLHRAAEAARVARSSLRRLITKLADVSDKSTHDSALIEQNASSILVSSLREKVQQDLAEMEACAAATILDPETKQGLHSMKAPGVPPRSRIKPIGCAKDLVPRLRLRAQAHHRVLAVTLWMPPAGTDRSQDCKAFPGCIALVLSSGHVHLWEPDIFCWHHTTTVALPVNSCFRCKAAFSMTGSFLWVVAASKDEAGQVADSRAPQLVRPQIFLFTRNIVGMLELKTSHTCAPGEVLLGPVPLDFGGEGQEGPISPNLQQIQAGMAVGIVAPPGCNPRSDFIQVFTWNHSHARGTAALQSEEDIEEATCGNSELQKSACFHVGSYHAHAAMGSTSPAEVKLVGLFPLSFTETAMSSRVPRGGEEPCKTSMGHCALGSCRIVVHIQCCREFGIFGGEVHVLTGLGDCLASLPLEVGVSSVHVPLQGGCPSSILEHFRAAEDPPPFVLLINRAAIEGQRPAQWLVCVAFAPDAKVESNRGQLRELNLHTQRLMPAPGPCTGVVAHSDGCLACWSQAEGAYLFDWQQLRVQKLPQGWLPAAMGSHIVVCHSEPICPQAGPELIFLEPS